MREAIGQGLLVSIIIFFIMAVAFLFVGSMSYSKAFKIKNRIINIIEEYAATNGKDSIDTGTSLDSELKDQIRDALDTVGYQVGSGRKCKAKAGGVQLYPDGSNVDYDYCVYKYETTSSADKPTHTYYGVTTYMTIHIPFISDLVELPVYGETKTFGILE